MKPIQKKISRVALEQLIGSLPGMDAKTFCDRWHGLDVLTPEESSRGVTVEQKQDEAWSQWGHRAKCVRLLAKILPVKEKTVSNWGDRFQNMPVEYRTALDYADMLRQQADAVTQIDVFLKCFQHRLQSLGNNEAWYSKVAQRLLKCE